MLKAAINNSLNHSKLYNDFLNGHPFFKSFFPVNDKLQDKEYLKNTAESFANRNATIKSITATMNDFNMTDAQKSNLEYFKQNNSLAVVAGQEISFLGGPLFCFYKIQHSIQLAKDLKAKNPEMNFVPVFWLEDNDHDILEASFANVLNSNYEITEVSSLCDMQYQSRDLTSKLVIPKELPKQLDSLFEKLPNTQYKDETKELYLNSYKAGMYCNVGFLNLLQNFFGDSGLLFLSASKARELGYSRFVALLEISNQWKSVELISRANKKLKDAGYHIQSKHSDVNLFYYFENQKHRIEVSATNDYIIRGKIIHQIDMTNEIIEHPERFSPNLMLRPLYQDTILPNIAYIVGPSEIAFRCQVHNIYEVFAVRQSALVNRHHAIILNKEVQQFLSDENLNPEYFFDSYDNIEKSLLASLENQLSPDCLIEIRNAISDKIFVLRDKLVNLSPELSENADNLLYSLNKELDKLQSAINDAIRNKNSEYLAKYKKAHNWISPSSNSQERMITPLNIILELGIDGFKKVLNELCQLPNNQLYILGE